MRREKKVQIDCFIEIDWQANQNEHKPEFNFGWIQEFISEKV